MSNLSCSTSPLWGKIRPNFAEEYRHGMLVKSYHNGVSRTTGRFFRAGHPPNCFLRPVITFLQCHNIITTIITMRDRERLRERERERPRPAGGAAEFRRRTEPNRTEPFRTVNFGTGRNRNRTRDRTEPDRATALPKNASRTASNREK